MKTTNETIVVRVGLMGMADEGIGTAPLVLDPGMSQQAIASAVQNSMASAVMQATAQVGPSLGKHIIKRMMGGE